MRKHTHCSDWTIAEWKEYFVILYNWNTCHSLKNFIPLYRYGFTHFTIVQNPLWRFFHILHYTRIGRYEQAEKEVLIKIQYKERLERELEI